MQAPLVTQLKQVGATHITGRSILNAVAAAMPASEARALSHTQGVKEVVPDGTIIIGDATSKTKTVAGSQVQKSAITANAADGQQLCNSNPSKPLIEPEALTSIRDTSATATGSDISGGNTATPVELAPGAVGTLTATLSPTAAAGTAVNGTLSVIDSTDLTDTEPAVGFPASFSDFHDFAYAYTVGS